VNAFHRARQRHGIGGRTAARFGRRQAQGGAHAFAAGEDRVAHRFVQRGGFFGGARQKTIERLVHRD
jgi:hypothetical protein